MPKMSKEHKQALAEGRRQARAVRNYLEALTTDSSTVNEETLRKRLEKTQQQIADEDNPAKKVELIQKRIDLEGQLEETEEAPDLEALEKEFKSVVKDYSERKGISYFAWREMDIPASVLRDAGVPRTRQPAAS